MELAERRWRRLGPRVPFLLFGVVASGCFELPVERVAPTYGDSLRASGDAGGDGPGDGAMPAPLSVEASYPSHADWNAYVRRDVPNNGPHDQTGTPCDGTESGGPEACVHGGELRQSTLASESSCADLSATDTLGVFVWRCSDDGGAGPVRFETDGFLGGKGLSHLVGDAGFLQNSLEVLRNGSLIARSPDRVWDWGNAVFALTVDPATVTILSVPGVYFLEQSASSGGILVNADRIALVVSEGATLSWGTNTAGTCNAATGEATTPDRRVLACVGDQSFVWLEGDFDATPSAPRAEHALRVVGGAFGRVHRFTARNSETFANLAIQGGTKHRATDFVSAASGAAGVRLEDASNHRFERGSVSGSALQGILLDGATGARENWFSDIVVQGPGSHGVALEDGSDGNTFHQVAVASAVGNGFWVRSDHNRFYEIRSANNADTSDNSNGMSFRGGNFNVVVGGRFYNNRSSGVRGCCPMSDPNDDNVLVDLLVTSSVRGIYAQANTSRWTLSHGTFIGMSLDGLTLANVQAATANNVLVANVDDGLRVGSSGLPNAGDVEATNFASANVRGKSVVLANDTAGNLFTSNLYVGAEAMPCDVSGTSEGLIDETCTTSGADASSDYSPWLSDAVLHVGLDVSGSFVGKVSANDAENASDSFGAAARGTIVDWLSFESPFRTWGPDGASLISMDSAAACESGTCRIWDWRPASADTVLLGRYDTPGGAGACPLEAHGDRAVTDQLEWAWYDGIVAVENVGAPGGNDDGICESGELCRNRFLQHALELVLDGVGDDDGLCESNEHCVLAPNIGAYQGAGDLGGTECTFSDGAVVGVRMFRFPSNGI